MIPQKNETSAAAAEPAGLRAAAERAQQALQRVTRPFAPPADTELQVVQGMQVERADPAHQPLPEDVPCCPFCGRFDALRVLTAAELLAGDGEAELYFGLPPAYAVVCDAASGAGGCGATSGFRRTREDAVRAWRNSTVPLPPVDDIDGQNWKGMDGGSAFLLIERHSEDWAHARRLMEAWLAANAHEPARDAGGAVPPTFAVSVAAGKWAELKRGGYAMQRVVFSGPHGQLGTIDPHGVVLWGGDAARSLHLLASGRAAMARLARVLDRARAVIGAADAREAVAADPGLLEALDRLAATVPQLAAPAADEADEPATGNWYRAEDIDRLVLELNRMLGGDVRAPRLCDVVAGVRALRLTPFALDALRERARQVDGEGYDTQHDDEHAMGELIGAATCYACATLFEPGDDPLMGMPPAHWPWAAEDWKPKDWRRNLQRAVALLLAEAERRERGETKGGAA